jgi:hypothetical protein
MQFFLPCPQAAHRIILFLIVTFIVLSSAVSFYRALEPSFIEIQILSLNICNMYLIQEYCKFRT